MHYITAYRICNTKNYNVYIGVTKRSLNTCLVDHYKKAFKHFLQYGLYVAMREQGRRDFYIQHIEDKLISNASEKEDLLQKWCDIMNPSYNDIEYDIYLCNYTSIRKHINDLERDRRLIPSYRKRLNKSLVEWTRKNTTSIRRIRHKRIICECGQIISRSSSRHKDSLKHHEQMNQLHKYNMLMQCL